ncbi:MAG TPA: hypothetical protein VK208_12795, partial [Pyrinomonadaceae bacterium]|nr:hypothetical protein [Pyrinomonadaceae bacterium]
LRFATLQYWKTDSATSWRYPSFVGIRGDREQQYPVRMIPRVAAPSFKRMIDGTAFKVPFPGGARYIPPAWWAKRKLNLHS